MSGIHRFCSFSLAILLMLGGSSYAEEVDEVKLKLEHGTKPPLLVLNGKAGGKLNGGGWNSNIIGGKVTLVMYVDPDNIDDNEHVENRIKETFKKNDIKVFGIVNADATWIPNFMLRRKLSSKQSHNELLTIVFDYERHAEKAWGLKDERFNVMAFDTNGKLFFIREGKLNESELNTLVSGIQKNIKISSVDQE